MALAAWILAFLMANTFAPDFARFLPSAVPAGSLRLLASFVSVFALVWFLVTLLAILLATLIKAAGLGLPDRIVGCGFGLVRGVIVLVTVVILAGLTSLPQQALWRNAMFSAPLEAAALAARPVLPVWLAKRIRY